MKHFAFFLLALYLSFSSANAANFTDLDALCASEEGIVIEPTPPEYIVELKHINGKITRAENYVHTNGGIYMVANTFTDDFKFLGAYLLRYDCTEGTTEKLSRLLGSGIKGLGFINYNSETNVFMVSIIDGNDGNRSTLWIYDPEDESLKSINRRKIRAPAGFKSHLWARLETYDGETIEIERTYYKLERYNKLTYLNQGNPDICLYDFSTKTCTTIQE